MKHLNLNCFFTEGETDGNSGAKCSILKCHISTFICFFPSLFCGCTTARSATHNLPTPKCHSSSSLPLKPPKKEYGCFFRLFIREGISWRLFPLLLLPLIAGRGGALCKTDEARAYLLVPLYSPKLVFPHHSKKRRSRDTAFSLTGQQQQFQIN